MIFSKWRRTSLAPAWEYAAAGVLWRLVPTAGGVFVIEDRDVEAKTVTFAGVEMRSGAVLWHGVKVDEPWWVSIESVEGELVVLHGYGTPDMPEHRKMYLLDLRSGALRWQNTELALLAIRGESLYATKEEFDRRRYFELELASGRTLRELDGEAMDALPASGRPPTEDLVTFPEACSDPQKLDEKLRGVVRSMAAAPVAPGLIEVLRYGDYTAVAVHVNTSSDPAHPSLTQRLTVRRGDRNVFEDTMSTKAAMSVPDGFFAAADRLYYMKEQRMLRALALHGS